MTRVLLGKGWGGHRAHRAKRRRGGNHSPGEQARASAPPSKSLHEAQSHNTRGPAWAEQQRRLGGGGAKEPSQPEQRGLGDTSATPIPDTGSSLRKGAVNGAVSPPKHTHKGVP